MPWHPNEHSLSAKSAAFKHETDNEASQKRTMLKIISVPSSTSTLSVRSKETAVTRTSHKSSLSTISPNATAPEPAAAQDPSPLDPASLSSPTKSMVNDSQTLHAAHWAKGVENARNALAEADIPTLDVLVTHGCSVDEVVDELKREMRSRGVSEEQSTTASRLQKILRCLDKYGKVVDVCVGHSPDVTSLVWGSMRLMIDVRMPSQIRLSLSRR